MASALSSNWQKPGHEEDCIFLSSVAAERALWLAVAQDMYEDFLRQQAVQDIVVVHTIHVLEFDPTRARDRRMNKRSRYRSTLDTSSLLRTPQISAND